MLLNQIKHIDYPAGSSIAIVKGVNAFELMMDDRHPGQGVQIAHGIIIDETFEVPHQRNDLIRVLGRCIDHLPGPLALQGRSWQLAESRVVLFYAGLDRQDIARSQQSCSLDLREAILQCRCIVVHFLGSHANELPRNAIAPVKIIMGRDDVFDGRTVLGFL
ncbi:hypothetical protein D3C78_1452790 [compost metagenome]